jgi:hypothetical protein
MPNPFAFIVGNPRSGTTLLRHIVDSHSQIAFLLEAPWMMNWLEKGLGVNAEGFVTPDLVSALLPSRRLFRDADLGISAQELGEWIKGGGLSWANFISRLCDRYGQARGKPLVGNKTPSFVRRLLAMHEQWPQAKFVHIIRDGRDVFLSARAKWKDKANITRFSNWNPGPWDENDVTTVALWWEWNVRLGREAGQVLGHEFYYEIRYENLVADPKNECLRLCEFLCVSFEDEMLSHEENFKVRYRPDGATINARVALPITPGLRNWQTEMTEEEVERFEGVAYNLLDELGYRRRFKQLGTASLEQAASRRRLFAGRPLPAAWLAADRPVH